MKYINKRRFLISFLIFTFSIQIIISQNISELIQPKCSKKKIEYSIVADMQEYLDNENNIDGRELYKNIDDLKSKKIGSLPYFKTEGFSNVVNYDSYESLINALRKHEVDAIFLIASTANRTQLITNDLTMIEGSVGKVYPGIVCKNETLYKQLTNFNTAFSNRTLDVYYKWMGITEDTKVIKNNLPGDKVIKYLYINFPPFNYKDENGEVTGSFIQFIFGFAANKGYKIEFVEANSINELTQAINDKSYDFIHYFREDSGTDNNLFVSFFGNDLNPIIRYSNLIDSAEWTIYDSVEEYNGEDLGCLNKYSFEYLYGEKFKDSKITYYDTNFDLLYNLMMEEIEGFLTDDTIAKNYAKKFPERITYFDMNVNNNYGLGFRKNNNTLLQEFNEFLKTIDVEKLYQKWDADDASNIQLEKNSYEGGATIKVGIFYDAKPFAYLDNGKEKGFEIDLIYEFAKKKQYNINLVQFNSASERLQIGNEDTDFDITGGSFTITEERAKLISFSDPIYKLGTSLIVRKDTRKDTIELSVYDNEYNEVPDNKAKLYSKVGDKIITSSCIFPKIYNYSIIINCTINDLNGTDPFNEGIESTSTTDILRILFSDLKIDNILKANEKLKLQIIQESDKSEQICSEENRVKENNNYLKLALAGLSVIGLISLFFYCL